MAGRATGYTARMKVVFFGTPEFAVPSLEALSASRHEVVLVVSRPDKPVGRRRVLTPPPVAVRARELGLAVEQPRKLKSGPFPETFRRLRPDAAVVVAYGRFIPGPMLEVPRHGFVNLHPSLLPRHRGPSPIQWALAEGDRVTGVTTMLIDEGMDTGPILLQREVAIRPGETAPELSARLAAEGAALVVETLDGLEAGTVTPRPQPEEGATVTPLLDRETGVVDWSLPAPAIVARFRAFTPWPGLHTVFRGRRLKLHGVETAPAPPGEEPPGTVLAADGEGILVRCGGETAVRITELQREGRRRLSAEAFLAGERIEPGERLG